MSSKIAGTPLAVPVRDRATHRIPREPAARHPGEDRCIRRVIALSDAAAGPAAGLGITHAPGRDSGSRAIRLLPARAAA